MSAVNVHKKIGLVLLCFKVADCQAEKEKDLSRHINEYSENTDSSPQGQPTVYGAPSDTEIKKATHFKVVLSLSLAWPL